MDFFFYLTPLAGAFFIASLAATVMALLLSLWRILPLHAHRRADKRRRPEDNPPVLPASVIVYSNDQPAELEALLPQILGQDYAPGFEVIVVNEGDSPAVRALVDDMRLTHRNLYLTHTPDGARNLSRKKLALTLGVKAARNPVVVMTAAGASVGSTEWLTRIMQHFGPDKPTEVVLGIAAPAAGDDTALWKRMRSFDLAADTVGWVADALDGRPWRGTEYNLAYRRDTFFANKGFSRRLNLRYGDDDIFISEIADADNTVVELSDSSIVEVPGANAPRAFRERNCRRRFTRRFVKGRPRLKNALIWWMYALAPLLALAGGAVRPSGGVGWVICLACLTAWALASVVWCNALTAMRSRPLRLTVPFLAAMRPARKIVGAIHARISHPKRYTWE